VSGASGSKYSAGSRPGWVSGEFIETKRGAAQREAMGRTGRTSGNESRVPLALFASGQANVLPSRQVPHLDSCAPDDFPHSIAYHGGGALSSPTRATVSNQPVASRFLAAAECCASLSQAFRTSQYQGHASGKGRSGLQAARERPN
jgi:hypothetical protein